MIRLAEAYRVQGTGVDISPFHIADAQRQLRVRAPGAKVVFLQMNGSDFKPETPNSLTLVSCIGASWVFGGHDRTLHALSGMVAPDGWVIVGEPYWRKEPPDEYLVASGINRDAFVTHSGNAEAGEVLCLELVHTFVSSKDDWDQYEGLQWFASAEYARSHPDDPDLPEILDRVSKAKATYLRWGRDTLGWAMYVFRHRPHRSMTPVANQQSHSTSSKSTAGLPSREGR